jgi:hypothetical protein
MGKRKRAAIWVAALSIICGLIIWHVVYWYSTGTYLEMFSWVGTDKAYITVLYNLGLMLVLGAVLGFLMEKITVLIGYGVGEIKHFDDEVGIGKKQ